jgi:hypothetical protein
VQSDRAGNAALAMIESEQPRGNRMCDRGQMACVHSVTMAALGRLGGGHGGDRHILAAATAASRLSRTFAVLVETVRQLRNGGSQYVVSNNPYRIQFTGNHWKLQENSEQ